MGEPRVLHCWEDGPEIDGVGSTCMLRDGHDGPHEWVKDSEILIEFPGASGEVPGLKPRGDGAVT